ncbi:hypothetical protein SDC9_169294 [bioreactor metagenome]|uniref:Uncharacterized protein n=1 Tax=bioreactor metagenome TaxID=1076179 RepID=A0A645G7G8_9ZZZZ
MPKQSAFLFCIDRIPSHVRNFESFVCRKEKHFSLKQTKTGDARALLTLFEQQLHSCADANKGFSALCCDFYCISKSLAFHLRHRASKRSNSRKYCSICRKYFFRVGCYRSGAPDKVKRISDTLKVSGAIIYDSYHQSSSFL